MVIELLKQQVSQYQDTCCKSSLWCKALRDIREELIGRPVDGKLDRVGCGRWLEVDFDSESAATPRFVNEAGRRIHHGRRADGQEDVAPAASVAAATASGGNGSRTTPRRGVRVLRTSGKPAATFRGDRFVAPGRRSAPAPARVPTASRAPEPGWRSALTHAGHQRSA